MPKIDDAVWRHLVGELKEFEVIAESLCGEVGNETSIELRERLQELKRKLGLPEWR